MVLNTKHVKGPERKQKYVCKNLYFTQTALEVHDYKGFATSVKGLSTGSTAMQESLHWNAQKL